MGKPQEAYRPQHNLSKRNLSGAVPQSWWGGIPLCPGWGVSHPVLAGGIYPILTWLGSTPSCPDQDVSHLDMTRGGSCPGVPPPSQDWGTPTCLPPSPRKDMGPVEVLWDGDGVSPRCGQTENITSRCTWYVGGNKIGNMVRTLI